jgi:hypothetical protein
MYCNLILAAQSGTGNKSLNLRIQHKIYSGVLLEKEKYV